MEVSRKTIEYLRSNADRVISTTEIAEATGCNNASIASAAQRWTDRDHHVVKVSRGFYRYESNRVEPDPSETKEMLIRIIDRREDRLLVSDEETGKVYTMREVEW